jgi:hypothetical protein
MPQSGMNKFAKPFLHPLDIADWVDGSIKDWEAIQPTSSYNVICQERQSSKELKNLRLN